MLEVESANVVMSACFSSKIIAESKCSREPMGAGVLTKNAILTEKGSDTLCHFIDYFSSPLVIIVRIYFLTLTLHV